MTTTLSKIKEFTSQQHIAVAGVSRKKGKFGNEIYKTLKEKGKSVYAINPNIDKFGDDPCYRTVESLPADVTALLLSTKPEITNQLIPEAITKGIKQIWVQQGAGNKQTLVFSGQNDANIIQKQCMMMFADPVSGMHGFHRSIKKLFGSFPK
jgi:uncharacterized protein